MGGQTASLATRSWTDLSPSTKLVFEYAVGSIVDVTEVAKDLDQSAAARTMPPPRVSTTMLLVGILHAHASPDEDNPLRDLLAHYERSVFDLNEALLSGMPQRKSKYDPSSKRRTSLTDFPGMTPNVEAAIEAAWGLVDQAPDPPSRLPIRFLFGGVLKQSRGGAFRTLRRILGGDATLVEIVGTYHEFLARGPDASFTDFLVERFPPVTTASEDQIQDSVPTLLDRPTLDDQLGRQDFAEILAVHIRRVSDEERRIAAASANEEPARRSFMLHIDGPWGAGKSSLMMLVGLALQAKDHERPWVVVQFNAWQNQRIDPPWWTLMDGVYQQALRQVDSPSHLRRREQWWRFRRGGLVYLVALLAAAAVSIGVWIASRGHPAGEILGTVGALVSLAGVIWASLVGWSRRMVLGSAQAARGWVDSARDPMREITSHYKDLLRWICLPTIVLIDDLDRCQGQYVVRLLEGIQTLFADVPVTYMVAADRRWLYASFEKAYETYIGSVHESGRSLGSLFLEKTFQLSTAVPGMSSDLQEQYWHSLIRLDRTTREQELQHRTEEAVRNLAGASTEDGVLQAVERAGLDRPDDAISRVAYRRAAALRIAQTDIRVATQHRLMAFAPLLEPNPRTMIRFVNSYSVQRSALLLEAEAILQREHLAQLIIIEQRWPLLLDYLQENPEAIGKPPSEKVPIGLRPLFEDEDVEAVISGTRRGEGGEREIGRPLTPDAVRAYAQMRTPHWLEQPHLASSPAKVSGMPASS
jgi:hypothetical protein